MGIGIAITGLNGVGKSTLAHALAAELHYFEMDGEDYYFPEQKHSRQMALGHRAVSPCDHLGTLPFSIPRLSSEAQQALLRDVAEHPNFILADVTLRWCKEILPQINMAFMIRVPAEERIKRIMEREELRFGTRVLPGGDMYQQQRAFHEKTARRDEKIVLEGMHGLKCPVIMLDGMRAVSQNLETAMHHILSIIH